jgi:hypothetical protein
MRMPPVSTEEAVQNPVLDELVTWITRLKTVGVSPDKAVEVARDFFLASCESAEEGGQEWDEDDDEDEN